MFWDAQSLWVFWSIICPSHNSSRLSFFDLKTHISATQRSSHFLFDPKIKIGRHCGKQLIEAKKTRKNRWMRLESKGFTVDSIEISGDFTSEITSSVCIRIVIFRRNSTANRKLSWECVAFQRCWSENPKSYRNQKKFQKMAIILGYQLYSFEEGQNVLDLILQIKSCCMMRHNDSHSSLFLALGCIALHPLCRRVWEGRRILKLYEICKLIIWDFQLWSDQPWRKFKFDARFLHSDRDGNASSGNWLHLFFVSAGLQDLRKGFRRTWKT